MSYSRRAQRVPFPASQDEEREATVGRNLEEKHHSLQSSAALHGRVKDYTLPLYFFIKLELRCLLFRRQWYISGYGSALVQIPGLPARHSRALVRGH